MILTYRISSLSHTHVKETFLSFRGCCVFHLIYFVSIIFTISVSSNKEVHKLKVYLDMIILFEQRVLVFGII